MIPTMVKISFKSGRSKVIETLFEIFQVLKYIYNKTISHKLILPRHKVLGHEGYSVS